MADSEESFVVNVKGKAAIWQFFRLRSKNGKLDNSTAFCSDCKASVKLGGGTSNMTAHIRRHHPLLLNKALSVKPKVGLKEVKSSSSAVSVDASSSSADLDVVWLSSDVASTAPKTLKQITLGEAIKKKDTYPANSQRASQINEKIGKFIVKD